jgi:multimeric flavodoxin WrbA
MFHSYHFQLGGYPYFTFNIDFREKPIINPGITHNIGNQTDPNNTPKLLFVLYRRLYGGSSLTNDKGQYIYYNKVGEVVVTGNEDGAKNVSRSVIYALSHIGFTIPPNVDTYWVGEAGPGPSFIEAEGYKNDFTMQHVEMMAHNLIHFARLLKSHPIPSEGNVVNS